LDSFVVIGCCFLVPANAQNTGSVFATFAYKKGFLQHAENCVNTSVSARRRLKTTVVFATNRKTRRKYRCLASKAPQTSVFTAFLLQWFQKNVKTPPIL